MNNRITLLAFEASDTKTGWLDRQKFAELIVAECCNVINAGKPAVNQVPAEVALDMTAKNVKAYFGVE